MTSEVMTWIVWILSGACIAAGFFGAVIPIIPGPPLIFIGALLAAWWEDFTRIGTLSLAIIGALTLVSVVVDLASSYLGAQKVGASRAALVGSIIGSVIGIFFLLPGIILGPFIGAFLGEWWYGRDLKKATRVGVSTWLGMIVGAAVKLAASLAMIGVLTLAIIT